MGDPKLKVMRAILIMYPVSSPEDLKRNVAPPATSIAEARVNVRYCERIKRTIKFHSNFLLTVWYKVEMRLLRVMKETLHHTR